MAYVALLAGVLAGCSEAAEEGDAKASAKASAKTSASASATASKSVESGGSIGAAGSACELPVGFDVAEDWKAEAVENGPSATATASGDGDLADELADAVLTQGPVSLVCEIDAKPAGNIGFLRVWTGEPGNADARTVLEEFVAAEDGASKERYSTFKTGELAGVQVTYLYTNELLEESKEESALAVTTADGPVVLHLGGMDTEEHQGMLPALELAKSTLRIG